MTSPRTVSVVIATVGRDTLRTAVESALRQTMRPVEVIVVLDGECEPDLPDDDSIVVLRTTGGEGPGRARHLGASSASGELIALLDDDDTWSPDKLERQLAAAPDGDEWIMSCRFTSWPAGRPMTFPRNLIGPTAAIYPYMFEFRSMRTGGSAVQTSTLLFPRAVAERVPISVTAGSIHDEPLWLHEVRRAYPALPILQLPESYVQCGITPGSVSRPATDRTDALIDWGVRELASEDARVRGDYFLTISVGAAVSAGSLQGVWRSIAAGTRFGRPGPWAFAYATAALGRIPLRRLRHFIDTSKRRIER
ncbi:glycosyltransferase family 2 protein [Mycobacterium sp. CPCC 205372]|uniref:Glycosyltransferase family 2 protein n=1 Tax=Mycobacterium hippophais TaxID=3016340 RepID=A0ABT4PRW0_9MYCO|nr:glycosyltransferase family 2 protein [Mycobacterium hippophais]MCZ8379276.1 glycosyltransferase family 2 protein [Mycobacterium hippophais]